MRLLKVVSVIIGLVFTLAGLALVTSGGFVLGVVKTQADPSGFFNTRSQMVGSYGFALTAPNINAQLGPRWEKWVPTRAKAIVRISGSSETPAPIFIGIAHTDDVSRYLAGAARDRIKSIDITAGSVEYEHVDGTAIPSAPGAQTFWVAKAQGNGKQTLEWTLEKGDWTVVIMNADASPPVAATLTLGAHFGIARTLVIWLTAGGAVIVAIGAVLIVLGTRRRRVSPPAQPRLRYPDESRTLGGSPEAWPTQEQVTQRMPRPTPPTGIRQMPPPPAVPRREEPSPGASPGPWDV